LFIVEYFKVTNAQSYFSFWRLSNECKLNLILLAVFGAFVLCSSVRLHIKRERNVKSTSKIKVLPGKDKCILMLRNRTKVSARILMAVLEVN